MYQFFHEIVNFWLFEIHGAIITIPGLSMQESLIRDLTYCIGVIRFIDRIQPRHYKIHVMSMSCTPQLAPPPTRSFKRIQFFHFCCAHSFSDAIIKRIFVYELVYCMNSMSTSTQLVEAIAFLTFNFTKQQHQPLHSLLVYSSNGIYWILWSSSKRFSKRINQISLHGMHKGLLLIKNWIPLPWFPFFQDCQDTKIRFYSTEVS